MEVKPIEIDKSASFSETKVASVHQVIGQNEEITSTAQTKLSVLVSPTKVLGGDAGTKSQTVAFKMAILSWAFFK